MESILNWVSENQQIIYIVILMIFVGIEVAQTHDWFIGLKLTTLFVRLPSRPHSLRACLQRVERQRRLPEAAYRH